MSAVSFVVKPKFRVVIDGTKPGNLSVQDAETGKFIPVTAVKIEADFKGCAILTLTTRAFECDADFPRTEEGQTPVPGGLIGSAGVEPCGTVFETYKAKP